MIFWGAATGAVAAVMLLAGSLNGDMKEALSGLQSLVIVSALPFGIVMGGLCVALVKDLQSDPVVRRAALADRLMREAVVRGVSEHGHDDLQLMVQQNGATRDETPQPRRFDRLIGRYRNG